VLEALLSLLLLQWFPGAASMQQYTVLTRRCEGWMSLSRRPVDATSKRYPRPNGDGNKVPHMNRVWHTLCRTLADGAGFENNERTREKPLTATQPDTRQGARIYPSGQGGAVFQVVHTGFHRLLRRFSWASQSHSARERPV
jgi:hypothetical protein